MDFADEICLLAHTKDDMNVKCIVKMKLSMMKNEIRCFDGEVVAYPSVDLIKTTGKWTVVTRVRAEHLE